MNREKALTKVNLMLDGLVKFDKGEYDYLVGIIEGKTVELPNGMFLDLGTDTIVS